MGVKQIIIFFMTVGIITFVFSVASLNFHSWSLNKSSRDGTTPYEVASYYNDGCVYISWKTNDETIGYIKYGNSAGELKYVAKDKNGLIISRDHKLKICSVIGNKYFFVVVSDGIPYDNNGKSLEISL